MSSPDPVAKAPKSLLDKLYDDAEALDGIKGMERIARHIRAAAWALVVKDMPLKRDE